jgi:hypothetical protein
LGVFLTDFSTGGMMIGSALSCSLNFIDFYSYLALECLEEPRFDGLLTNFWGYC